MEQTGSGRSRSRRPRRTIAVFAVLGAWSLALVATGALQTESWWGTPAIFTGVACLAAAALGGIMRSPVGAIYGVLFATAAGTVVAGANAEPSITGFGVLGLLVVGATVPIAIALADARSREPREGSVSTDVRDLLRELHDHVMLSDNAKRVLFRERELELIRKSIERDLASAKYDAAIALCNEMANAFGYRQEAEAFRGRILQARQERYEADVRAAFEHLDELLAERNWRLVHQEAARIRRLFGESHLVQDLDRRITRARDEHKAELEVRFLHAAERDDVEEAMPLLRELDRYLAPADAERLADVALGVVAKHRENLGMQFKLAVNDRRWGEAARIGQTIMDEFPNTKMAEEVRSMADVLRIRATQAAALS